MTDEWFEMALKTFLEGCHRITAAHCAKQRFAPDEFTIQRLQKRARIVYGKSAHCFVDYATGDVLKAASWTTPAKHARGNIFDEHNGLGTMGPYGPAYLR